MAKGVEAPLHWSYDSFGRVNFQFGHARRHPRPRLLQCLQQRSTTLLRRQLLRLPLRLLRHSTTTLRPRQRGCSATLPPARSTATSAGQGGSQRPWPRRRLLQRLLWRLQRCLHVAPTAVPTATPTAGPRSALAGFWRGDQEHVYYFGRVYCGARRLRRPQRPCLLRRQ